MAEQLIQIPVQLIDFRPRKDRSWRVTFETPELQGDEVKILTESFQGEGWMVFKPNREIDPGDVPNIEAEVGLKTPSQRYRNKLYIYWKQQGGLDKLGAFDNYYREHYAKLTEILDSKLEPQEED
jgi:hypothetical protein